MDVSWWCRGKIVFGGGRAETAIVLVGHGAPDLAAVDAVARTALRARRNGGRLVVVAAAPDLWALVQLAGLPVEMEREPEGGEEALGLEEGEEIAQAGDPPA